MERATLYDRAGVKRRLLELFEQGGHGVGSRLARHVGVSATSANRWGNERGDTPDPSHWPAIEEFFSVEPGDLARAGGVAQVATNDGERRRVAQDVVVETAGGHDLTPEERAKVESFVLGILAARED